MSSKAPAKINEMDFLPHPIFVGHRIEVMVFELGHPKLASV
jgi:hypothetical protein